MGLYGDYIGPKQRMRPLTLLAAFYPNDMAGAGEEGIQSVGRRLLLNFLVITRKYRNR